MAILDELLKATNLELPRRPRDEFWELLVCNVADNGIVSEAEWVKLSDSAQDWANAGMRAVTARNAKGKREKAGKKWSGDAKSLEISPLVAVLDSTPDEPIEANSPAKMSDFVGEIYAPAPPAPKKPPKRGGKKRASKKKAAVVEPEAEAPTKLPKKKAAKRSRKTMRPSAFKRGHCYWFIYYMITKVATLAECDHVKLLERFREFDVNLQPSSANMMMYDTITVLRVLRDLGLYEHAITNELPKNGELA